MNDMCYDCAHRSQREVADNASQCDRYGTETCGLFEKTIGPTCPRCELPLPIQTIRDAADKWKCHCGEEYFITINKGREMLVNYTQKMLVEWLGENDG